MTLKVDFDRDLWLYIPRAWPWEHYDTMESWRDEIVRLYSEAYDYNADTQDWLRATLEGFVRSAGANEHRFVYFPTPHDLIGLVALYELPQNLDYTDLHMLGADDPNVVRTPKPEPFDSEPLGLGTKCVRFVETGEDREIVGVAHWLWRLDGRDILMMVGDANLERFDTLQSIYDDFARGIALHDDELEFEQEQTP